MFPLLRCPSYPPLYLSPPPFVLIERVRSFSHLLFLHPRHELPERCCHLFCENFAEHVRTYARTHARTHGVT